MVLEILVVGVGVAPGTMGRGSHMSILIDLQPRGESRDGRRRKPDEATQIQFFKQSQKTEADGATQIQFIKEIEKPTD